mgnify:FL=1
MNGNRRTVSGIGALLLAGLVSALPAGAEEIGPAEKPDLKLGFIKLTDMAPLAIAKEKHFFFDEGLFVDLEAQSNWRVLQNRVARGALDGAHMLAGQPIGASIGVGGNSSDIVTAFSMDLNGNAITVSNDVWEAMRPHVPKREDGKPAHPISAEALAPVVESSLDEGESFDMGMVYPLSTHNYEIRYWLAAGGLHPGFYEPLEGDNSGRSGADVRLSVTPPPQMPSTMEAGTIQGYCVGEPWNQQAVAKGIGVPVVTNHDIWPHNPEKVFGVTREWAEENPNTHLRVLRALIRAAHWLDENGNANREEAVEILSDSRYVGADEEVIANSMTGTFEYEPGDVREEPDFNVFFRHNANYPYYSDAIWFMTQMRRWGQISERKPDDWYMKKAREVYKPAIYEKAARSLVADGTLEASDFPDFDDIDGFKPVQDDFIDGRAYNGREPNAYINSFDIGLSGDETP